MSSGKSSPRMREGGRGKNFIYIFVSFCFLLSSVCPLAVWIWPVPFCKGGSLHEGREKKEIPSSSHVVLSFDLFREERKEKKIKSEEEKANNSKIVFSRVLMQFSRAAFIIQVPFPPHSTKGIFSSLFLFPLNQPCHGRTDHPRGML